MGAALSERLLTRRLKKLSRSDGFLMGGNFGVEFFPNSDLLHPKTKVTLQLIIARSNFYNIGDNLKDNIGIVNCSLYTRRIALKHDHYKK